MADDAKGAVADQGADAGQSAADAAVAASQAATDKAAGDGQNGDDAAAKAAADAKQDITYDLKLPEGSTLDPALLTRTAAIARERGLTNEQAQAMVDLTASESASIVETALKSYQPGGAEWTKQADAWKAATLADPKLGPTPDARAAAIQKGISVIERFGTADPDGATALKETLDRTGLGNEPTIARFFAWLGDTASEGSHVTGEHKGKAKTPEERWYPGLADKKETPAA